MNEQTQQLVEKWLAKLDTGADFMLEQAPLYIQDMLGWYCLYHAITLVVTGVLFVAFLTVLKWCFTVTARIEYEEHRWLYRFIAIVLLGPCMLINTYFLLESACSIAKVTYYPRVVVVDMLCKMK